MSLRLEFPPNSSPPTSSSESPWTEQHVDANKCHPPFTATNYHRNGLFRRKRRTTSDQQTSQRRNTFVINFNGFKNGFRPRNIGNRFRASPTTRAGAFSPPYAIPGNLISGTSWTSANGFQLTSHHQLNTVYQTEDSINGSNPKYLFEHDQRDEDPNQILEIESDDSPPYLPSSVTQQRPTTVTPQPTPTAPPHDKNLGQGMCGSEGSSITQVDLHEHKLPFQFHLQHEEDLSC